MPRGLHHLVLQAARRHAGNTAAVLHSGDSARTCLTYRELITVSQQLTEQLHISVGEHREQSIGLFCTAHIHLPAWIIGVLQLPAAYVPLDPVSPPLLTLRIMEKCSLRFCLIQNSLLQQFQGAFSGLLSLKVCTTFSTSNLTLVKMQRNSVISSHPSSETQPADDQIWQKKPEEKQHPSAAVPTAVNQEEQLAYILHTSGTTGLPKIVKVPHKCIVPNILHLRTLFQMTPEDVVFLASPLTFDPSVVEMFLALTSGACLLMVPSAVKRMPGRLARVLFKENKSTVLQATPALVRSFGGRVLREVVLSADSSLRVLALGGEACPSLAVLRSWKQERNKTRIFNLYGTTEVSCWACCYELPNNLLSPDNMDDGSVPLGGPLMDTALEVRDKGGGLVTEGEGQAFIGGQDRVCLLDDEITAARGTMRATGDWVMVKNSHTYYLGRKDRLVKRHGQRVNLDALQQIAESLPQVDSCVMGLHEGSRLVGFVVPTSLPKNSNQQEQHNSRSTGGSTTVHNELSEDTSSASTSLEKEVLQRLSQLLPSHSVPDTVLLVAVLPLTNHGKVDMGKLMRMYEDQRQVHSKPITWGDTETAREKLQTLWKECLGFADDQEITDDSHFMLSGGDSLQALRLFDYITVTMGTTSPGLLEVLLDGSFSDVLKHITATAPHVVQTSAKRQPEASPPAVPPKRPRIYTDITSSLTSGKVMAPVDSSVSGTQGFVVVRRAGEVLRWGSSQSRDQSFVVDSSENNDNFNNRTVKENHLKEFTSSSVSKDIVHITGDASSSEEKALDSHLQSDILKNGQSLSLQILWSSDTGKCVDASPVLLAGPGRDTVFIGSHSHRLQALDLTSGEVIWERVLGDRLESSAAVTKCGTLVAVGSYDGRVYFLRVDTGETWWEFETGDAVKSSPTVDPQTGLVAIGSHDGHVYALEPLAKHCVWKHHCGSGAVFSSPCIHSSPRQLYSATLRGQLHCLNPDSGHLFWKYSCDVPFFSSPSCSDSCVCIGSVNGLIIALSHSGDVLWNFLTDGPVFSSPCLAQMASITSLLAGPVAFDKSTSPVVVCGSHDCCVYGLNASDGSLLWRFQATGKVYSSPFVFDGSRWGLRRLVAIASTDGTVWVLDGEQGTLKASLCLPGELFSSPVVWGTNIVVGCRNDFVYCLKLSATRSKEILPASSR
uniref:Aminoadipate-semialdehyde dehydrogenase n=1 Tax=Astyanax mexicanus TaxID=7994 RepID=A0A3B1KH26_ASTMX